MALPDIKSVRSRNPTDVRKRKLLRDGVLTKAANDHDISIDLDYGVNVDRKADPDSGFQLYVFSKLFMVIVVFGTATYYLAPKLGWDSFKLLESGAMKQFSDWQSRDDSKSNKEGKPILRVDAAKPISQSSGLDKDLENIAFRLISSAQWNNTDIELFSEIWLILDGGSRAKASTSVWYQHFCYKLEQKLERSQRQPKVLLRLASQLGIYDSTILQNDLERLVEQFTEALEEGELDVLEGRISENIVFHSGRGRSEFIEYYNTLFNSTVDREYTLSDLSWQIKDTHAVVSATMQRMLLNKDGRIMEETGSMRLIIKQTTQGARVTHYYRLLR